MEGMEDVIVVMVCPEASNPIGNISIGGMPLPCLFKDHTSKYQRL